MRARVYSWFSSGNVGDILIAEEVARIFSDQFDCVFYDISSFNKVDKPVLLSNSIRTTKLKSLILSNKILNDIIGFVRLKKKYVQQEPFDCDLAIFAGGNPLMELNDLFAVWSRKLYELILTMKKAGIKVAFCYAGVGPFGCKKGERYVRRIVEEVDFISVRDDHSLNECERLGKKNVTIWRDPVLMRVPKITAEPQKMIAINVYFGNVKKYFKKMFKSYVYLIKYIAKYYPQYKIVLFNSEIADKKNIAALIDGLSDTKMVFAEYVSNVEQIYDIYSRMDFLIGTRMHSVILGLIYQKPFMAIGWQSKVKSLIEYFDLGYRFISQDVFCKDRNAIISVFDKAFSTAVESSIKDRLVALSLENNEQITEFIHYIK